MRLVNTQTEQGANDEPEQRRAEAGDKAGGRASGRMWAMRALATEGIQKGHMRLHRRKEETPTLRERSSHET